jgi:tetratricopeptide (TPR) repeat protein
LHEKRNKIKIRDEIKDHRGLSESYNNIGSVHHAQKGNYEEALKWYEKSRKIREKIGELARLVTTYTNIGEIYDVKGEYKNAITWFEKSSKILKDLGNWHYLSMVLEHIVSLYLKLGNKGKVKRYLEEIRKLYAQLGIKDKEAQVQISLGLLESLPREKWEQLRKEFIDFLKDKKGDFTMIGEDLTKGDFG